jgi:hypothetical protein
MVLMGLFQVYLLQKRLSFKVFFLVGIRSLFGEMEVLGRPVIFCKMLFLMERINIDFSNRVLNM